MKDVCLVQMPYTTLTTPSLALGLLKSCLLKEGISCKVFYGDLKFAQRLTYEEYMKIGYGRLLHQMGEASFADFVWDYQDENWKKKYLDEIISSTDGDTTEYLELLKKFNSIIPEYLEDLAAEILAEKPRIVGCSSNFQQNNASLALLKVIKRLAPDVVTVMGGCNCALESGQTLVQEADWLDYTFSGDGEKSVPQMCRKILKDGVAIPEDEIPYGVMSEKTATSEPMFVVTEDIGSLPFPDYDDYFDEIKNLKWIEKSQISLSAESSRGCWWRERGGCTFCGLCMTSRKYRKKDIKRFLKEIVFLKNKYGIPRFFLTDSILSNEAVRELPELITSYEGTEDIRFFSEVKSNLSKGDLRRLKEAGVYFIQPGIEALQDDLLKLMNKGNRAIKHIELLKNARRYNIRCSWNLLFGFPKEKEEWVRETEKLIPYITHLQPPNWVTHIVYQKYSHYYEEREEYELKMKPLKVYDYIYGFNKILMQKMAYNYCPEDSPESKGYFNISERGEVYAELMQKVLDWQESYYKRHDCLQMIAFPDRLSIMDLRKDARSISYEIQGVKKKIYLFCDETKRLAQIMDYAAESGVPEQKTLNILKEFENQRIMVSVKDEYLSLAVCIADHSCEKIF